MLRTAERSPSGVLLPGLQIAKSGNFRQHPVKTGCFLSRPLKRTYQESCSPGLFFYRLWPQTFGSKTLISAEWRCQYQRNHYSHSSFGYLSRPSISKISAQNTEIPAFALISETESLQRLFVGKTFIFNLSVLYYVYRGLNGFMNISFRSYPQTPQKAKSL